MSKQAARASTFPLRRSRTRLAGSCLKREYTDMRARARPDAGARKECRKLSHSPESLAESSGYGAAYDPVYHGHKLGWS
jgi:hypothetical protein